MINKLTRARNITLDYFTLRDCGPQRDRNLVTCDKLIILLGKTQWIITPVGWCVANWIELSWLMNQGHHSIGGLLDDKFQEQMNLTFIYLMVLWLIIFNKRVLYFLFENLFERNLLKSAYISYHILIVNIQTVYRIISEQYMNPMLKIQIN